MLLKIVTLSFIELTALVKDITRGKQMKNGITVLFQEDIEGIMALTCGLTLTLPLNISEYSTFEASLQAVCGPSKNY